MSEEIQPKKRNNGGFIAAILVLLGGAGFLGYKWSDSRSQLEDCSNTNKELNADMKGMNQMLEGYVGDMKNDLKTDFKNMLATYDALMEKDASKTDSLMVQKEKIQQLMDDLDKNKRMSAWQLKKLRDENGELKRIMRGYIVQIDSLNTLNLRLTSDLDSTRTALDFTTDERDKYKQEAETSSEILQEAAKLNAYGFSSMALKPRVGSGMKETTRAKAARQLVSNFTISKNSTAEKGNLDVYMQIVSPDGKVLQRRSSDIVTLNSGKAAYSAVKPGVNYQGQSVDVSVYYDLNETQLSKGNYKVKIFCRGEVIGTDSFTLK